MIAINGIAQPSESYGYAEQQYSATYSNGMQTFGMTADKLQEHFAKMRKRHGYVDLDTMELHPSSSKAER